MLERPSRVRVSRSVQVTASSEPDNVHCCGSRAGTSLALVSEYERTTFGSGRAACHKTCAGGPMMHHLVRELPSYVWAIVSLLLESSYGPPGAVISSVAQPKPVTLVSKTSSDLPIRASS